MLLLDAQTIKKKSYKTWTNKVVSAAQNTGCHNRNKFRVKFPNVCFLFVSRLPLVTHRDTALVRMNTAHARRLGDVMFKHIQTEKIERL